METTVTYFFVTFCFLFLVKGRAFNATLTTGTVFYSKPGGKDKYQIEFGVNDTTWGLAVGSYVANVQGWDKIWVRAIRQSVDESANRDAVEAMGYFEGYTMQKSIFNISRNNYADWFKDQNTASCAKPVYDWLVKNHEWVKDQTQSKLSKLSDVNSKEYHYWSTVSLYIAQFEGLMLGYNAAAPREQRLTLEHFLLLNADGDVESIIDLPGIRGEMEKKNISMFKRKKNERCSALFKFDPVVREVYFGHTTWDNFDMSSLRQLKSYQYDMIETYDGQAYTVVMSSSPGFLSSVDDFYLTNNRLAIIETTNGNFNKDLWGRVHTSSVLSWMRVNVANMMSSTGKDWVETFCNQNSGTYNNQWMILDILKIEQFQNDQSMKSLLPGTFWVLEQIPGTCTSEDKSEHLNEKTYWASYNIPAFPNIWKASGFDRQKPKSAFRIANALGLKYLQRGLSW